MIFFKPFAFTTERLKFQYFLVFPHIYFNTQIIFSDTASPVEKVEVNNCRQWKHQRHGQQAWFSQNGLQAVCLFKIF